VMANHYHLCVETPQPNLVQGMRWLQATFSLRFNRLRNERGHVFQGRYKALVVDPDAVGAVCHYIHLNPVRAGVVPVDSLAVWLWSSCHGMMHPGVRPSWASPDAALAHAGNLKDTPAGRRRYLDYLAWLQEDDAGKRKLQFDRLSKDWAVGTREFKKDLLKAHKHLAAAVERKEAGPHELAEEVWEERVRACLAAVKKTNRNVAGEPKGAPWKVAIAAVMKDRTTASNPWLARRLNMGSPFRLSRLACACRAEPARFQPYPKLLSDIGR